MGFEDDLNKLIKRNKDIYIFLENIMKNNEDGVIEFVNQYMQGRALYRFRSGKDVRDLENLKSDSIWGSSLRKLNDPFEGKIFYSNDVSIRINDSIIQKSYFNMADEKRKYIMTLSESFKNSFNVACFTEELNNFNMWANYANSFGGYCLEYDMMNVSMYINSMENKNNGKDHSFYPVIYESVENFKEISLISNDGRSSFEMIYALLQKPTEFLFEKEWRVLVNDNLDGEYDNRIKNGVKIEFIKPVAIYLGKNISPKLEKEVKKICIQREIKIYKMKEEFNNKNIIFEEINL